MFSIKEIIKEKNKYIVHYRTGEAEIKIVEYTIEEFNRTHNLIKQAILKGKVKVTEEQEVESTFNKIKEEIKSELSNEVSSIKQNYEKLNGDINRYFEGEKSVNKAKKGFEKQLEKLVKRIDELKLLEQTAIQKLTEGETERNKKIETIVKESNKRNLASDILIKDISNKLTEYDKIISGIKTSKNEQDAQFKELSSNIERQRRESSTEISNLQRNFTNSIDNKIKEIKVIEPPKEEPKPPVKEKKKVKKEPKVKIVEEPKPEPKTEPEPPPKKQNDFVSKLKKNKVIFKKDKK